MEQFAIATVFFALGFTLAWARLRGKMLASLARYKKDHAAEVKNRLNASIALLLDDELEG
jgi:hypothetical protein